MEGKIKKRLSKKVWISVAIVVLLAVLFVPLPSGTYKDGGTRAYTALTYKVVNWRRLVGIGRYENTSVYYFPNNFKSIDTLWEQEGVDEKAYAVNEESFEATVLEVSENGVTVEPLEGEWERTSSDRIVFSTELLDDIGVEPGDIVEIIYNGTVLESYPAQIVAKRWKVSDRCREMDYLKPWIDKATAEKVDGNRFKGIRITKIYADCFFGKIGSDGYTVKLNGTLSGDWCVGDQVTCACENLYFDAENQRREADMLTIEPYVRNLISPKAFA